MSLELAQRLRDTLDEWIDAGKPDPPPVITAEEVLELSLAYVSVHADWEEAKDELDSEQEDNLRLERELGELEDQVQAYETEYEPELKEAFSLIREAARAISPTAAKDTAANVARDVCLFLERNRT